MNAPINRRRGEKGQATILVTLALLAMFGLIGLAVDFGWAFYVRRSAQAAADSAALAATRAALQSIAPSIDCLTMGCDVTPVSCDLVSAGNLLVGCTYAQRNGFAPGGNSGHQAVTIQANTGNPATAPGVSSSYWVTVRVSETVPQLFSALLGHPLATVSARATGAVADVVVTGSLILLNRSGDASPVVGSGADLAVGGSGTVTGSGGILMASNASNSGTLSGSSRVINTAFTHILGSGKYSAGSGAWQNTPTSGYADGSQFFDPLREKGQPPLPSTVLPSVAVAGGALLGGSSTAPTILQPGNYYATSSCGTSCIQASGNAITFGNGYFATDNAGAGFGTYIFYGGMSTNNGTNISFAPGRYVLAGANGGTLLSITNKTILVDHTAASGVPAADAGEIFVFTDLSYPGMASQVPALVSARSGIFTYGSVNIQGGNNTGSKINLHGLNQSDPSLPAELYPFAPVVMWQDQGNSHVKYTIDGDVDTSCVGSTINSPCTNSRVSALATSPQLTLQGSPFTQFFGAIYQPRGAWTIIQGSGSTTGPLQIVTGALNVQGSGTVLLQGLANPLTSLSAVLVE